MSTGLFLVAMVCGMAGAALLGFFLSPRAMEDAGIASGSSLRGAGLAGAAVLAGLGIYLIITNL